MKTAVKVAYMLILSIALVSCGGKEKKEDKPKIQLKGQSDSSASEDPNTAVISITGNDLMRFNKTEIKVKAGQKVKLTLTHVGKMDVNIMGHNFVLLKQGTDLQKYVLKAVDFKDNDYIPDGDETIAHTKMLGGGQNDTVEFDAPAPGTYDFICSFPGHLALMKGKFIVE